jgi:hypothetical protein
MSASYSCTALVGSNKTGVLKPDADGYYTVVLGALNFFNSAGQYYPLEPAKKLFDESSILVRRAKSGDLRMEYGHPKFQPGMSKKDYLYRIMDIYEVNVCAHIAAVWLDDKVVKDDRGNPIVAILGKIKPSGPHGAVLKEQLENAKENVCFSIRSITDDYRDATGQVFKIIKEIYTWDYVNEPGISAARKWLSPALESLGTEMTFEPKHLIAAANLARLVNNGMESNISAAVTRTMESLGWATDNRFTKSELILPPSARW